jgi:hypothetical protein
MNSTIDSKLIGEAWSTVQPFENPQIYGSVELDPRPGAVRFIFSMPVISCKVQLTFLEAFNARRNCNDRNGAFVGGNC